MKLGIVCRSDHTGLGYQTRNLAYMLKPDSILLIDSTSFNSLAQHPEWYKGFNIIHSDGIPGFMEYQEFLKDIDVMLTAETPYVYEAWNWAKMAGVKTFCQPNWEFFDGLIQPNMPHPDKYLMPSYWHLEEMQDLFPGTEYLPCPINSEEFEKVKEVNLSRKGKRRFLHIVGSNAIYDRSGWSGLRDALEHTTADFELLVYSQTPITGIADPRVKYHIFDVDNQADLYKDFDAMIYPRRYGGNCLPMNEALLAGLPVIMPDISPNNRVLPKKWLLPAYISANFEGRSTIDVYSVEPHALAHMIDKFCAMDKNQLYQQKLEALRIGQDYSDKTLKPKYEQVLYNN